MAGTLTRLQMVQEVLDNMAKTGSLTLQSGATLSSRAITYLNRAQNLVARQGDYLQYIATASTVAGQRTYQFPSGFRSIFDIRLGLSTTDINTRKLTMVQPETMDRQIPAPDVYAQTYPWFYVPYMNTETFELFPLPDQAYLMTLRYSTMPTALTTDAQVSDYTSIDDALVAYATMYGFRWMQELKDATYWEGIGNAVIKAYETMIEDSFPDWSPQMQGFSVTPTGYTGEYWNNPFVRDSSITEWSGR